MNKKVLIKIALLALVCTCSYCNDMNRKFEEILHNQLKEKIKQGFRFSEEKLEELSAVKVIDSKKIGLESSDVEYYYISWQNKIKPEVVYQYIYKLSDQKLVQDDSAFVERNSLGDQNSNYILDDMDYKYDFFPQKPNFFREYKNSAFYLQCEEFRIADTFSYFIDIDDDGNDEIISFCTIRASDICTSFSIQKYFDNEWRLIFNEAYFGWEKYLDEDNYALKEWNLPKPFPYDFIEYKGKKGLRVVFYDNPVYEPTHYIVQFWVYNENKMKFELMEETWEEEEFTPSDGLIFVKAKKDFFTK